MLRKTFLLLIVLLAVSAITFAQPDSLVSADSIAGPATWGNDRTWIINNLNDEVRLTSGMLTIQAGTTVKFAVDNSLIIDGGATLTASGTEENPITFCGTTSSIGSWGSIKFNGDTLAIATGTFRHCVIKHGGDQETAYQNPSGPIVLWEYATVEVDSCEIDSCLGAAVGVAHGDQEYNNSILVEYSTIYQCGKGVSITDQNPSSRPQIKNNVIMAISGNGDLDGIGEKLGTDGSFLNTDNILI